MSDRLVNWQDLEVKISGSQLDPLIRAKAKEAGAPVQDLRVRFEPGLMKIKGKSKAILSIPFTVEIRKIEAKGKTVVVHIDSISAAGLPVPKLLSAMFDKSAAKGAVKVDGSGPSVTILLDRFLPDFIDVELETISIVKDGLVVRAGRGGADLPEGV